MDEMKNKLYILMGPSGSGKSTKAKKLAAECCICEADQYWLNCVGDYLFVPSKLGDAHKWCQNKVESLMKDGKSRIVVANTSLNKKERQIYHDIAKRNDYDVEVVLPDSPWFLSVRPRLIDKTFTDEDVKIFVEKSTHGVPFEGMKRMFMKYEED
jgi:predicted kinase